MVFKYLQVNATKSNQTATIFEYRVKRCRENGICKRKEKIVVDNNVRFVDALTMFNMKFGNVAKFNVTFSYVYIEFGEN